MESQATVGLAWGLRRGATVHRDATVRALTGHDEEFALAARGLPRARLVSLLLARCARVGGAELGPDGAAELTVGDREALLLHAHRLTFGPRLRCRLRCAQPGCGAELEMDLDAASLLPPAAAAPAPEHTAAIAGPEGHVEVRFRLPTGGDQEAVAAVADPEAAADLLLRRTLLGPDPGLPGLRAALGAAMERLDPGAHIVLGAACPACGADTSASLDAADYLLRDLASRAASLRWDVHNLAVHYHWSEDAILSMPASRRRMYCRMIEQAGEAAA